METTINQRIKRLIDEKFNGNKRAFAGEVGISPTVVENIVGTRQGKPSFDVVQKIYAKANIRLEWLIAEEGEMEKSSRETPNQVIQEYSFKTDRRHPAQQVPLYNIEAAAGLVTLFDKRQYVEDYISIPNLPKCDGAIYITGDSMYPLLKSGDIVMYREIKDIINSIFWGEMYLLTFDVGGDLYTMVKWLQKSELGPDYIKLVSENQHHQPKDILLKNIKAAAIIKASIRINSMS